MRKSYKYRIYPSKSVIQILEHQIELCRNLYNCALEHRITAYRRAGISISYYDQQNELPEIRQIFPEYKKIYVQVLRVPLQNLDKAYKSFFRRIKNGEIPGFPRFKGKNRFNSICFPQYPQHCKLVDRKLIIGKIGTIKIKYHREIIGTIKTTTIKRTPTNKWYVTFSCDNVPLKPLSKTNMICGIDMGIKSFITTSGNDTIENPKFFKQSHDLLIARQQKLSKANKGTRKREKLRLLVAKVHEKIANQRRDFHFKTANNLVKQYDVIFHEDLDINSMFSFRNINRNIMDAAWKQFLDILSFKAEEAGKKIIKIKSQSTTETCSTCGNIVPVDLTTRIFFCPHCNISIDRDYNAALNILRLGVNHLDSRIAPEKSIIR